MMRIITGKARGIRLKTLDGDATRPTAERVKEAVFSMLQFDVENRTVLDLFSGSGQLALEALSRGASSAVLVDRSPDAVKIIQENAKKTRLSDSCSILQMNAIDFIRQSRGKKFDLIFIDPPYASNLYVQILQKLLEYNMLKPTSLIICESDQEDLFRQMSNLAEQLCVKKNVRYGKTTITIFTPVQGEDQI